MKNMRPNRLSLTNTGPDKGPSAPWANPGGPDHPRPFAKMRNVPGTKDAVDTTYRQHYELATKGTIKDNGGGDDVQSMASLSTGKHPGGMVGSGNMKDGSRGAGKPIKHTRGRMPAQASPDHGDH